MLVFKPGVSIFGLQPEVLWALDRCVDAWESMDKNTTVTGARGGVHSRKSLHYAGHAVDLRTRDLSESQIAEVNNKLITALGPNFDVVLESDHFHIEYQPKGKHGYPNIQPYR